MNKLNSKSFGIVIYMDDSAYKEEPKLNKKIHFPIEKQIILLNILKCFYNLGIGNKYNIEALIIAHEHGEKNEKCHMHVYIEYDNKIRKQIKPGSFQVEGNIFLYMVQQSKTPAKLRNYIKKGKDYYETFPNKTTKDILKENQLLDELMDVDDPYDVLLKNDHLSDQQISNIFKNCNVTDYKKDFINNAKKIYETYNNFVKRDTEIPQFKWLFPTHILEYVSNNYESNDKVLHVYTKLYTWFKTYCEPEGYFRRKALFLFSLAGGLGKSYFARSLVPEISICNSPYYVYCRGTLDASEFIRKKDNAKLIILDDVNYIDKDMEIWKALTVSEPTNIRSPYHNFAWKKSLPCILLSNNIKTLKYWLETEDLKTRCIFIGIDFYIGPPGTDNETNHKTDTFLTDDITEKLYSKINKCSSF
jgi:hypothetical protein